ISSYWREGAEIALDLDPEGTLLETLRAERQRQGRRNLTTALSQHMPGKVVAHLAPTLGLAGNLADQSDARLSDIVGALRNWRLRPTGSEGYRTAEV
ncbi:MAG TPA: aminoacetone oxidase family FAD-binding enzyme, partial [Roseovarius sp.]|nr:aminoacetone oxidase family FAD-binding enzyme [Roseovarius sp.]